MRGLHLIRSTFQSAIWGISLAVCISGAPAQYSSFSANYGQQPRENQEEMTIGEMLADQEIAEQSARQSQLQRQGQGQAIPVTMTDYRQNVNSGVSQAAYETNSQNPVNPNPYAAQPTTPPQLAASAQAHSQVSFQENPSQNSEPRQLPEDFPTGTMAPLNPQSLISFSEVVTLPEGPFQQVTIIDPTQKALCVYHINMGTGQIELKSARKIEWDLQMIFLNSKKPLPQDVQAILQQTQKRR
jgi:hypothetical protein